MRKQLTRSNDATNTAMMNKINTTSINAAEFTTTKNNITNINVKEVYDHTVNRGTSYNTHYNKRGYGLLAVISTLFLFGGIAMLEQLPFVNVAAAMLFCIVNAVLLLFSLMKLDVMEFQPGSFWYRLNLYINREKPKARAKKQPAHSIVYAMLINK